MLITEVGEGERLTVKMLPPQIQKLTNSKADKCKSTQKQRADKDKSTKILSRKIQQLHTNSIPQMHESTKQQRLTVKLLPAQKYNAIAIVKGIRFSEEHATM